MRYKRNLKRQKKIILIGIFGLLLCLSFGYAAFNTNINLNTKGNISVTSSSCFTVSDNGDGTGTITDYDVATCGTKVKIPSRINNLTITKIASASTTECKIFSCKGIQSLIFPDTLEYIGNASCIRLNGADIVIPSKVKEIGNHAFAWGTMHSIKLNEGLETIGTGAFEANELTYLKIPSSVKNMYNTIASSNLLEGDNAFVYAKDENGKIDNTYLVSFGDKTRKNVIIPSTIETIANAAFVSNRDIETITIPNSVKNISANTFWSMVSLKEVNIDSGIVNIEANAFNGVPNLNTININRKENAIVGSPWGAVNAKVNWLGVN